MNRLPDPTIWWTTNSRATDPEILSGKAHEIVILMPLLNLENYFINNILPTTDLPSLLKR